MYQQLALVGKDLRQTIHMKYQTILQRNIMCFKDFNFFQVKNANITIQHGGTIIIGQAITIWIFW